MEWEEAYVFDANTEAWICGLAPKRPRTGEAPAGDVDMPAVPPPPAPYAGTADTAGKGKGGKGGKGGKDGKTRKAPINGGC